MGAIVIRRLEKVPDALPVLARWFAEEWEPYYGPDGPGDAGADLVEATGPEPTPMCFVALNSEAEPVGTVSLRKESLPTHRQYSPWVAALLVRPQSRGQGIGEALIDAAEAEARRLGFRRLYVGADRRSGRLARRGWKLIDEAPTLREVTGVWALRLGAPA